jgi:hypothetical protein
VTAPNGTTQKKAPRQPIYWPRKLPSGAATVVASAFGQEPHHRRRRHRPEAADDDSEQRAAGDQHREVGREGDDQARGDHQACQP